MRGTAALTLALLIALYAGYRLHRHFLSAPARPPTEIPSHCPRTPNGSIPHHPIVAFGDSITNGLGANRRCIPLQPRSMRPADHRENPDDTTYPADLARLTATTVLNYGYGGETTNDGLRRLHRILQLTHPHTILIMEGTNDTLQGTPIGETISNLQAMVRAARAAGAHVVLLTIPELERPQTDRTGPLNRSIEQLGEHDHITVIRLPHLDQQDINPDGIHPNDRGYLTIARAVADALHA